MHALIVCCEYGREGCSTAYTMYTICLTLFYKCILIFEIQVETVFLLFVLSVFILFVKLVPRYIKMPYSILVLLIVSINECLVNLCGIKLRHQSMP